MAIKKGEDILNQTKNKEQDSTTTAEGVGNPTPNQETGKFKDSTKTIVDSVDKGDDLLGFKKDSEPGTAATDQAKTVGDKESKAAGKEEPAKSKTDDWTLENALKEIKKLREENKARRLKYEDSLDKMKKDLDGRMKSYIEELEEAKQAKKELENIKTTEADKKRTLEEKIAHREKRIAELEAKAEQLENSYKEKLETTEAELQKFREEQLAQEEMYKQKVEEEISSIPEKFKDLAKTLVKGAGNSRDASLILAEAKLQGLFDDKTVVVNHSVPNASTGARATKERLEEAAKAERDKMTPQQKIKEALRRVAEGEPNNAFRR